MIKNCLIAVALASLALAGGCAKGGNGVVPTVAVSTANKNINASALYPGQPNVKFTATVTGTSNATVTWSLSGTACTGTPNPCGTIDQTTGVYQAPEAPVSATVTATLQSDSSVTGTLGINVVQVAVVVTPGTPTAVIVGQNLVQQFTAIAVPDAAPQTFTWSPPTCNNGANCGTIAYDANNSDVATYTAGSVNQSVVVAATWNPAVQPTQPSVGQAKVTVATSRLATGTYAFQFSGYASNGDPVAVAGSFNLVANGTITAGVEDVLTAGTPQQFTISSVQYVPNNTDNNLGTLTVSLSGVPLPNIYTAVLTSSGVIRMIESSADGTGITGSGVLQKSAANTVFNAGAQNFVFGFTGVDAAVNGKRVGYVGWLPLNGAGGIGSQTIAGLLDANDNGTNVCGAQPCSIATTSNYSQPDAVHLPTWWNMTLTTGTTTQYFDFFVAAGTAQTKTGPGPLTLYAISVANPNDPTQPVFPALSGSMVYQVPLTSGYNNAAFSGTSVSNLTGANANVSLTVGTTDGTSSGTGGTGGFTGSSDQNDNGTIISIPSTKPFSYTYAATGTAGRYTFQMLGNPNATTVVPPLPFILYASGANRGFLLDQSGSAVMTGTMDPQPASASYAASELPGTYAAAPIPNGNSTLVTPAVENLLLTSPGEQTFGVAGTQNTQSGSQSLTGSYTLNGFGTGAGTGTISLTFPPSTTVTTYVIYAIDTTTIPNPANPKAPNLVITDFMMMGTCTPQGTPPTCSSGPPSSIIFAQQ